MREIRQSGSMRGCRKRAATYRACVLLYISQKNCKSLNLTWRTSHGAFKTSAQNSATAVQVSFSG